MALNRLPVFVALRFAPMRRIEAPRVCDKKLSKATEEMARLKSVFLGWLFKLYFISRRSCKALAFLLLALSEIEPVPKK